MTIQYSEGDPCTVVPKSKIPNMAYTNCRTRIVDLRPLNLPTHPNTPDSVFRQLYNDYISAHRLPGSPNHTHSRSLASAVTSLTTGIAPPVAFPTETVYGLGADATNSSSIAGIFTAKGRPSDNPLIVHVSSVEHLERCLGGTSDKSAIPTVYHDLIRDFWPGPLTILIPVPSENQGAKFAPNVHPGQSTVGFRLPSSPYARFLIAVTDRPIAAPSANSSGKPSPTTAKHVLDDLDGKINFILDGGSCDVGVESTVVDGLGAVPLILRPGGLSKVDLKQWGKQKGNIWAQVENGWEVKKNSVKRKRSGENGVAQDSTSVHSVNGLSNGHSNHINGNNVPNDTEVNHDEDEDAEDTAAPRAPGMKYKHYAPSGRMLLIEASSTPEQVRNQSNPTNPLEQLINTLLQQTHLPNPLPAQHQNGPLTHELTAKATTAAAAAAAVSSTQTFTISILTSTSWPAFANLDSSFSSWHVEHMANSTSSSSSSTCKHVRLTMSATSTSKSDQDQLHESNRDDVSDRVIDMYSIDLGHNSTTISNRLFAALRTCDDLRSDLILAEAPTKVRLALASAGKAAEAVHDTNMNVDSWPGPELRGNDDDEFETVLERMRKAASEIVQL